MLRPVLELVFKTDITKPDVYDPRAQSYANGSSQNSMLEEPYYHVCLVDSLRMNIDLAADFGIMISLLDKVNVF